MYVQCVCTNIYRKEYVLDTPETARMSVCCKINAVESLVPVPCKKYVSRAGLLPRKPQSLECLSRDFVPLPNLRFVCDIIGEYDCDYP